jgi:hypothetical protein
MCLLHLTAAKCFLTRLIKPDQIAHINCTMRTLLLIAAILQWSHQSVDAIAGISYIVGCSTIKATTSNFEVCAISDFGTGGVCVGPACQSTTVESGNGYTITQGLKQGTDLTTLSEAQRNEATRRGIRVQVNSLSKFSGPIFNCTVAIQVKGKFTKCKSCQYCGDQKFTADCTNIANGRKATCELATTTDIYFPLQQAALSAPISPPTKAPVKSPVRRAPINWWPTPKSPTKPSPAAPKTPARSPIKWIRAPTK